jgi:hypothetical protein
MTFLGFLEVKSFRCGNLKWWKEARITVSADIQKKKKKKHSQSRNEEGVMSGINTNIQQ